MKLITSFLMLLLLILWIVALGVSSVKAVFRKRSKNKSHSYDKKLLESSKIILFTASISVIIKYFKMMDFSGLIKLIQEEIIATSIGLTLILFVYTLIIQSSFEDRKQLVNY